MTKKLYIIILLCVASSLYAQNNSSVEKIRNLYQSFDYQNVIKEVKALLLVETELTEEEKIELFIMSGVSNYSIGDLENSRKSFIDLLKENKEYELDPALISPKIVTFFANIKRDYHQITEEVVKDEPDPTNQTEISDNSHQSIINAYKENNSNLRTAFVKSMLFPGLGHLSLGENTKGWILSVSNSALLGGLIYTYIETNSREEAYLNETDVNLLNFRYEEYNDMYKIRNILLGTYIAFWLYSQIDLFLFDDQLPDQIIGLEPSKHSQSFRYNDISLSLKVNF